MLPDYQFRKLSSEENLMLIHNANEDAILEICAQYTARIKWMEDQLTEIEREKNRILDVEERKLNEEDRSKFKLI